MTSPPVSKIHELKTAALFGVVGGAGFLTDFALLHIGVRLGLTPAWARVISLFWAMQVTFTINGLFVFRCLSWKTLPHQWLAYLAANGFGNFCNYWIFVTLISLHSSLWSTPLAALTISSAVAWVINYCGTRFFAFRRKTAAEDESGVP